ncbi:MAG: PadR family transcriptional regulator, partial [Candidatus Coproplasma sp.]
MLDDLNENNDNLTENNSTQEENNSPLSNDELENNADETLLQEDNNAVDTSVTDEGSSAETNTSDDDISTVREADNSSALSDGDGNPNNDSDDETASSSAMRNEENNSISADLIRGHINTIILRALLERDKYGYEIINDIESKSHGQYTLKQPTLYSALKRLENQGYIKAYWKTDEVTLGGRRKYFTLTESGKAITEKNLSEWEYSRTIIDSLISDKSFDFARPAPSAVDFTLLRDSVSRVPTARGEEKPASENAQQTNSEATAQQAISQHPTQTTNATSFIQAVEYYSVISDEKGKQLQNQPIQGEGEQLTNQVNQQSQVSQIQATQEQTIQG